MTLKAAGHKKEFFNRIIRGVKSVYLKVFRINDSPHKIAAGFGLGVFLGILPATGVVAAIFLAVVFKVNRASAILGSIITNTWITIPFFFGSIKIGAWLSGTTPESIKNAWTLLWQDFHWSKLLETAGQKIFVPVIAGYLFLSLCAGVLAYVVSLGIALYIQHKRALGGRNMLLALLLMTCFISSEANALEGHRREMFVSVIERPQVLASREEILKLVVFAQQARIKTLYIQIYRANQAWFPSRVGDPTPYKKAKDAVGEDPFAFLIEQAHAQGIEVHAWLNLLSLAKNTEAPLLKKYGVAILTKDAAEKKSLEDYKIDNQYFLEPGDPHVRRAMVDMVREVLTTYPKLDGVQFDYIRYPDTHPVYGYAKDNVDRFKQATGKKAIDDADPVWKKWKRDQVTGLLRRLIREVRAVRPGIHISTTGCMGYIRAYEEAFQDWPSWVNSGLIEYVTIMSYPDSTPEFIKNIADAKKRVSDFSRVHVGIGVYKLLQDPESFANQLTLCQDSNSGACVFFYYSNLAQTPALKEIVTLSP